MQMHTDDDLYRVDDVYLGPRGRSMPFRVRYRAYWIGGVIFFAAILVEASLGVIGLLPALYALVGTVLATTHIMRHIDYERTAKSMAKATWQEINTPRPARNASALRVEFPLGRLHRRPFTPAATITASAAPAADADSILEVHS